MLTALKLLMCNPKRYVPLAFRIVWSLPQRALSCLFARSGFYLQEQMDIHAGSAWYNAEFCRTTGGFRIPDDPVQRRIHNLEPWDATRRDMLVLLMRSLLDRGIAGDIAELGVYRGKTARLIHHYLPDRNLHLFDTFDGFPTDDLAVESKKTGIADSSQHYGNTDVERVERFIEKQNDNVHLHKGAIPASFPESLLSTQFAFVHIDMDLYAPTIAALELFYGRTTKGGIILVHDYNAWPGPRRAVDEFFSTKPETPIPMPDKSGSVVITRL